MKQIPVIPCTFCSETTIQKRNIIRNKVWASRGQSLCGLVCNRCRRFSCSWCLRKIVSAIPSTQRAMDTWCIEVESFLSSRELRGEILGHCCEFRDYSNEQTQPVDTSMLLAAPPAGSSSADKGTLHLLDGCLFFPEYRLLVDSPLGDGGPIDIHGLSAIGRNFPGVYHGVISLGTAVLAANSNVRPDATCSSSQALTFGENLSTLSIDVNLAHATPKEVRQAIFCFPLPALPQISCPSSSTRSK